MSQLIDNCIAIATEFMRGRLDYETLRHEFKIQLECAMELKPRED